MLIAMGDKIGTFAIFQMLINADNLVLGCVDKGPCFLNTAANIVLEALLSQNIVQQLAVEAAVFGNQCAHILIIGQVSKIAYILPDAIKEISVLKLMTIDKHNRYQQAFGDLRETRGV